jgi:hypothetical protein
VAVSQPAAARQSRGHVTPACAPSSWNSSLRCTRSGSATPGTPAASISATSRRGPHQALDALATGITARRVNWVLDADIRDFFGQLDRD